MADLKDFGLGREDLLEQEATTNAQDLTAFGLTAEDVTGEAALAISTPPQNIIQEGEIPGQPFEPNLFEGEREARPSFRPSGALGQVVDMAAAFNRSAAGIANLPLSLINAISESAGLEGRLPELQDIDVIRQATQGGFGPEGFVPEALETVTEFFAGGLGFQAGAKALSAGLPLAAPGTRLEALSKGLDDISKVRLQTDILASFGGGVASTAVNHSQILKDSTTAQIIAPLIGGVAAVAPVSLLKRVGKGVPGQQAKTRASEVLVAAADDPDKVVRSLAQKEIVDIGGAAQSGDVGVMTLSRSLARESPTFEGQLDEQFVTAQRAIQDEVEALFTPNGRPRSPTAAQDFVKSKIDDLLLQLDERATIALEKVANIALLKQGKIRDIDVSRSAKIHLERALIDVKNQSNVLWNLVGKEVPVDTAPLKQAALEVVGDARKATKLPKKVLEQIIGFKIKPTATGWTVTKVKTERGYGAQEPVGELIEQRSNLLAELRVESKDAISTKQAPIYQKLQGAVIDAIENNPVPQGVDADAYRVATTFTRRMHETFDQGIIGRVLTSNTKSGETVLSEETLKVLLASGRERQAAGARELTDIAILQEQVGGQPVRESSILKGAQEFIAAKFQKEVIDPESAANFMIDNEEALRRFPQLRNVIAEAMQDIGIQSGKLDAVKVGKAAIEKSVFAKIAGLNGKKAINSIIGQKDPAKTARELKKLISQDPDALRGFQRDIADVVLDRSLAVSRGLPTLEKQVSKANMSKILKELDPIIKTFYTPAQRKNLVSLQTEASKLQTLREQVAGGVNLPRNMLMDLIARGTGARLASSLVSGGGAGPSLIAAQAGSTAGRSIIFAIPESATKAVLEKAMLDKDLMSKLLKRGVAVGKENDALIKALSTIIRQDVGAQIADDFDAKVREMELQ